jgi:ubiquinone/menaquinone biosynthesis C-methylase UbiE
MLSCHGGFSLDEATRRSWYNPEAILRATSVDEGAVFVDVGCGDGFFSVLAARKVGESGMVYAVDIDVEAIERLKTKARERRLMNIRTKVGAAEETIFCTACADIIFYSMVLHDFKDPAQVLRNARKMLKPSGILVDLDWKKHEMPFGPPVNIRFSEPQASQLIEQAGFKVKSVKEAGLYHYLISAKAV